MAALESVRNSPLCFGCGKQNEAGLRLDFELLEDGRLETHFTPRDIHGGWAGVFHGGLMATLLDEAMLAHLHLTGVNAATASLDVRFRKPVQIGEELTVFAWRSERRGRRVVMAAEAKRNGQLVASATAKCLVITDESRGNAAGTGGDSEEGESSE